MAEDYKNRKDLVEFLIPPGWEGLEGVEEGGTKDFICSLKKKGDGVGCVMMVEGVPVTKPNSADRKAEMKMEPEDDHSREGRYQKMFRPNLYSS